MLRETASADYELIQKNDEGMGEQAADSESPANAKHKARRAYSVSRTGTSIILLVSSFPPPPPGVKSPSRREGVAGIGDDGTVLAG